MSEFGSPRKNYIYNESGMRFDSFEKCLEFEKHRRKTIEEALTGAHKEIQELVSELKNTKQLVKEALFEILNDPEVIDQLQWKLALTDNKKYE